MQEHRWFGPPGTGKTSRLANLAIPEAVKKYGPDKIVITSFTKAAAREIAGRDISVSSNHVGTLHALCYRLLGNPKLTEKHIKDWNSMAPSRFHLTGKVSQSLDEGGVESENINGDGDAVWSSIGIKRAKMIPENKWFPVEQTFYSQWKKFKEDLDLMDFTDLIETAAKEFPYAPGRPEVIFVDEAQDFTPLQLKLVRSWGIHCRRFILVGDDDQTLYYFAGATPDGFLKPDIDSKYKKVLSKSWRVPRVIHERAMNIIKRVRLREEKQYFPKVDKKTGITVEGAIEFYQKTWQEPEGVINLVTDQVSQGLSVMILASCSYMIDPIKHLLRSKGLPFHNPYRTRRADWNPLLKSNEKITATDLLLNFLGSGKDNGYWNVRQFYTWAKYIKSGNTGLIRKTKKAGLEAIKKELEGNPDNPQLASARPVFAQMVSQNGIQPALDRNVDWFIDNLASNRIEAIQYPIKVLKEHGISALQQKPSIMIGTIHSVKGGEADTVILFPDISYNAYKEAFAPPGNIEAQDAIYRLFYVGMTRAREKLILMTPVRNKGKQKQLAVGV